MKTTTENFASKRDEKQQINIRWNSRLYFQIGLISSLFVVFLIMQTNFKKTSTEVRISSVNGIEEPPFKEYVIEVEKPKPVQSVQQSIKKPNPVAKVIKSSEFVVKSNSSPEPETQFAPTDVLTVDTPEPTQNPATVGKDSEPRNILNVEFVPIFPGCEIMGTNAEKIDCMSSKINAFITKNFRKEVLEKLGPKETHRIYVNFKIDSNGSIAEVKALAQNEALKREATRVIKSLPTFSPGKQGDIKVDVFYTVPITFQIQ